MKKFLTSFSFFFLLLFLTPALALNGLSLQNTPASNSPKDTFLVFDEASSEILTLSPLEYIKGAVAAEMPMSYHTEAVKAQAVASHSFALHRVENKLSEFSEGVYLSTSPSSCQGYKSEADRREMWGEQFDTYEKKLTDAVSAVIDDVLLYEDKPILAMFHAVSGGATEACADIFGVSYPYLTSAESASDELSADFLSEKTFTPDEMKTALSPLTSTLSDDPAGWFGAPSRTSSGAVTDIPLGEGSVTGAQLRNALSLPSLNFTVTFSENTFTVRSKGFGHGVGMSQYGADFLARQGSTYEQILLHYYNGANIGKRESIGQ